MLGVSAIKNNKDRTRRSVLPLCVCEMHTGNKQAAKDGDPQSGARLFCPCNYYTIISRKNQDKSFDKIRQSVAWLMRYIRHTTKSSTVLLSRARNLPGSATGSGLVSAKGTPPSPCDTRNLHRVTEHARTFRSRRCSSVVVSFRRKQQRLSQLTAGHVVPHDIVV